MNDKINLHPTLLPGVSNEYEVSYWKLVKKIINTGELRSVRGAGVYTLFGEALFDIDISSVDNRTFNFPLFTSRKVGYKSIVEEALMILRGDVDTKVLSDKGIRIWEGNTSQQFIDSRGLSGVVDEGHLGPMYGFQLRHFGAPFTKICSEEMARIKKGGLGYDQLSNLVSSIKRNPNTRTLLLTTFNPAQVNQGVLYPCTGIVIQFFVSGDGKLHQIMYQRSADILIGVPHNVGMYAFINQMVAKLCGLKSGTLKVFFGDVHVYSSHIETLKSHFETFSIYNCAKLRGPEEVTLDSLSSLCYKDFDLLDYKSTNEAKFNMFVG